MHTFQLNQTRIEIGALPDTSFQQLLNESFTNCNKIILVDENTHDHCLEYLITTFPELENAEVMLLPAGEENKVMEVCFQVFQAMSEYGITRNDVIINLGGGVVTDMGGFMASIYKRGIRFINIPTTLLGMVDAAIGGKTGIDMDGFKNQLGSFYDPIAIYIDPGFLHTLPEEELLSGYAEMLKHGLIADPEAWDLYTSIDPALLLEEEQVAEIIGRSVYLKAKIVMEDPKEKGKRKALNFGHTIGHGIESVCLQEAPITHGHAVALGMIAESYLSMKRGYLSQQVYMTIINYLSQITDYVGLTDEAKKAAIHFMKGDKKNDHEGVRCVLLKAIGEVEIDVLLSEAELMDALNAIDRVFLGN